jgi:uncharacterized protein (DUF58 family)
VNGVQAAQQGAGEEGETGAAQAVSEGRRLGSALRLTLTPRVRDGRVGNRLGLGVGSSLEFEDYRPYQPGDDLRRLDWGVYARTDQLVLRTYRQELSPRLDLFVDTSRSMALPAAKGIACWRLAGALAAAAAGAGLDVLAWRLGGRAAPLAPPGADSLAWGSLALDDASGPEAAVATLPPLRRGGVRILISDLLFAAEPSMVLQPLLEGASAGAVVQLAAAVEVDPELSGEVRLRDVESGAGADLQVTPAAIAAYREARRRHLDRWEETCRRHQADRVEVRAEEIAGEHPMVALATLVARGVLTAAPQ